MLAIPRFFQNSAMLTAGVSVPPALASTAPNPLVYANLDGNGIKLEWDIQRTRTQSPDQGTLAIYNLGLAARTALKAYLTYSTAPINALLPLLLEFSIGWGGLVEKIYAGKAWKWVLEKRVGEDLVTILEIGDGTLQVENAVLGSSFADMFVETAVLLVVSAAPPVGLGYPIDPVSAALIKARAATLPVKQATFIEYGDTRDTVDGFMETLGLEWKIHNGKFIVLDRGNAATASPVAVLLQASGGLLTWEQTDSGGISCTALANPNVAPGTQIVVMDSFNVPVGSPAFRVERVRFHGATDGESLMEIEARKSVLV